MDNQYIDTTTMVVIVKASRSTGGTGDTYILYKDLVALDSTSQVARPEVPNVIKTLNKTKVLKTHVQTIKQS